jgi:beta-glucosidase/6-phospho-beta-glucosidase/beta-galactosidase
VNIAQVEHAVADGCDVRGLLYWTLVDNFEWAFGWAPRFGLFRWEVDEPSQV